MESFRDLNAWKEGNSLVILIYSKTSNFPLSEQFGLTNQMRRAAVSITSNIAEGFVRNGIREKMQFYYMSQGSVAELQNQVYIAHQVGYIEKVDFDTLNLQCEQ